jgi:hypothetical protein
LIVDNERYDYLKSQALRVLDKCGIVKEINVAGRDVRLKLHVPSGDMKYQSFWIRDAAMMASCGLITSEEMKDWIQLISICGQNGNEEVILDHGLWIPPWSIADHINFDGRPVFFPGTYCSGIDQGDGSYGFLPPHDNPYYFIEIVYLYCFYSRDIQILHEAFGETALIQKLELAFRSFNIDNESLLCMGNMPEYTVDWGFCDMIKKSGYLLFPSLLRYRAALRLISLFKELKDADKVIHYTSITKRIQTSIVDKFYDSTGWLLSATEVCRQKDIWGTAFALYLDTLEEPYKSRTIEALVIGFDEGIAVNNGYVRHILVNDDFGRATAWERTACPYNTYQNGGYWATPSGWYIYGLSLIDEARASKMVEQFVLHCKKFENENSPFEWRNAEDSMKQGKAYGASAVLPFEAILRMEGFHANRCND